MSTRITALMPVRAYHRAYLERAIGCVLGQTSPRWRLLVIDDGATGDEFREVMAVALADDRIGLVRSERPGIAGAINTGIRQASTEFVAVLLGDDLWSSDAVEVLTSYIERFPDVDFFHSSRRFIDENDQPISSIHEARDGFKMAEFARSPPVKHLLCYRRTKALAIGGVDESLPPHGADDWDFPWSMAEAGARFKAAPECVYMFRDHRDHYRLTTHVPRSVQVRAIRQILRKHGVGWLRTERKVAVAKRSYLRQSLFRSRLDRWLKKKLGYDARRGWREPYS